MLIPQELQLSRSFFALTQGSAFLIFADIKKAISKYILK